MAKVIITVEDADNGDVVLSISGMTNHSMLHQENLTKAESISIAIYNVYNQYTASETQASN